MLTPPTLLRGICAHDRQCSKCGGGMRGGGEGRARVQERRELEGASGGGGGGPPCSRRRRRVHSKLVALCRTCGARRCGLAGGLVAKKKDHKWDVAVASAHVGRATASGTARCRRCRGRHVGRGGRVGPCRTCDGVGAGPAVGGGEPTRRTWRSRRPRSDVRRRRRRLRGRRCRANRWDVASASAHVGRATAAEAGQPSDVAAPRVGPRLLLHVRQKSTWRIDRAARET